MFQHFFLYTVISGRLLLTAAKREDDSILKQFKWQLCIASHYLQHIKIRMRSPSEVNSIFVICYDFEHCIEPFCKFCVSWKWKQFFTILHRYLCSVNRELLTAISTGRSIQKAAWGRSSTPLYPLIQFHEHPAIQYTLILTKNLKQNVIFNEKCRI